ncbi:MAG: hypothetical protein DSY80_00935 [Desulfocapsa sp.]|nr:MAG: hypothetical protein DSY80_00935 [Desulfocapsa sp.]
MKSLQNYSFILFSSLLIAAFTFGDCCHANEYIKIKNIPPPQIIAENGKAKMLYGEVIRKQQMRLHPTLKHIVVSDKRYLHITNVWFKELVKWTEEVFTQLVPDIKKSGKLPKAYSGTFATFMTNMANVAISKRYNIKGSALIGLGVAKNMKPWGTTKADGKKRDYIIALTESGYIVYDFRTHQMTTGKKFPNRDYLTGLIF